VSREEIRTFAELSGAQGYRQIQAWREQRRIPRWVVVSDDDNELLVDFGNVLSVETFVDLVRNRPVALLKEVFPDPTEQVVEGPEGRFCHELIVPFTRRPATRQGLARGSHSPVPRRVHSPGSNWLYLKLYCGDATADRLLRDLLVPVVEKALGASAVDRWFFIRYADPHPHLRVRFRGRASFLVGEFLPEFCRRSEPFERTGELSRLQVDTYEPELERYGGVEALDASERIFQADSEAVLRIVTTLAGDEGLRARWHLALRGMDLLLDGFGFVLDEKAALSAGARDSFAKEFSVGAEFEHQLGQKFRGERTTLERLLVREDDDRSELSPGLGYLRARSDEVARAATVLRTLACAGKLTAAIESIAVSHLHMHANRLLRSAHRAQELVLYDFLGRLYRSQLAQRDKGKATNG
jgi:thiopeptide-type bacteriocin biosynthesis protein